MPRLLTIDDDSYAIHPIYAKFKGWRSKSLSGDPISGSARNEKSERGSPGDSTALCGFDWGAGTCT
jgi:hypothetical protein